MEHNLEAKIIQTLDGRLPKRDNVSKETHENKSWIKSNSGANNGWVPKGINFPKVELEKFDGT